jgi:uroporphyrinogen decarboxylase
VNGFKELVKNPELCCEVTLQPVDILNVDAAIIFSDILVVPEAMGLDYEMIEQRGPWFEKTIRSDKDFEQLSKTVDIEEKLGYVLDAISLTKKELNGRVPLIGFAGAPWTIFCYMVEGKGSKTFSESRKMLYANPELAHKMLNKITNVTIEYLKAQIRRGADLVQVFDSWAGILSRQQYAEFCIPYLEKICNSISEAPVTIFSKGAISSLPDLANLNCNTLGLDWNMEIEEVRKLVSESKTLQGNMDPCLLYAHHQSIEIETKKMLDSFKSLRHIVNLGHGIYPDTDFEKVKTFINTIKSYEIK